MVFSGTPSIKLTAMIYNWNIVESGIKHNKPTIINIIYIFCRHSSLYKALFILFRCAKKKAMWAFSITWRPSLSVVRRKLFQKSSPLKLPDQLKPNLVWIITRVSSFKIVSGDAVHQPTWPLLLKSTTYGKIEGFWVITQKPLIISEIWHGVKMISTARSTYPAILK